MLSPGVVSSAPPPVADCVRSGGAHPAAVSAQLAVWNIFICDTREAAEGAKAPAPNANAATTASVALPCLRGGVRASG